MTGGIRGRLAQQTFVMAVGTALSRVTGLLKLLALVYAVHFGAVADAYNLSNTLPNIIHDIVLGGILSATFVPVFVSRLANRSQDEAWEAISAVCSVTLVVIAAASVVLVAISPVIIDVITAFDHSRQAGLQRHVAIELLILFVPQLACYGFVSLSTALLNANRVFAPPMFTPILNNLVLVVILFSFGALERQPTLRGLSHHNGEVLLLGLGTTFGVVVQVFALVPSLRRAGLKLRWVLDFRHEAVRTVIRLSGWTFGLVAGNQLALIVVLTLAVHAGQGAVTAYTYAYTFFQLPYGVVAVSIMSATSPELAEHYERNDMIAFRRRLSRGLRAILAIIIPAAAVMVVLSHPTLSLLGHIIGRPQSTALTADALSMLALGLPGFCIFLYGIRALQSMQDLRSAFWLYALENGLNIVLAVILAGPLGLQGIMLSISIAYTVSAVATLGWIRQLVGQLRWETITTPLSRIVISTAVSVAAAVIGVDMSASQSAAGLFLRVLTGAVFAAAGYLVSAGVLARLSTARPPSQGPGPNGMGGEGGVPWGLGPGGGSSDTGGEAVPSPGPPERRGSPRGGAVRIIRPPEDKRGTGHKGAGAKRPGPQAPGRGRLQP